MTTALPPSGAPSTPPLNGHYSSSSPKISRESGKTPPPLKDNSAQPLIKTLRVFLDANLSQAPNEAKKINGRAEQIPSIPDILKLIVERKEDIIHEENPNNVQDFADLFESVTNIKDSSFSSSLINFQLLDALFSIAYKIGDLQLSNLNKIHKSAILTYCGLLSHHYRLQGGENTDYFFSRKHDLLVHYLTK